MLLNITNLTGYSLAASDGEIGQIGDFYFDDISLVVRYLVAATGTWLADRQVLLSPHVFGCLDPENKILHINLTREQIVGGPPIHPQRIVSRHYEAKYYGHFGLPPYWEGGAIWGRSDLPATEAPSPPGDLAREGHDRGDNQHLRSLDSVNGYEIYASEGSVGIVRGFIADDASWAIREIVVRTGHWFSGRMIAVPAETTVRISHEESEVFASLTREDLVRTAEKSDAAPSSPAARDLNPAHRRE